jgi:hypothetical protein
LAVYIKEGGREKRIGVTNQSHEWGEARWGSDRPKDQQALKRATVAGQKGGRITAPRPLPHLWP